MLRFGFFILASLPRRSFVYLVWGVQKMDQPSNRQLFSDSMGLCGLQMMIVEATPMKTRQNDAHPTDTMLG